MLGSLALGEVAPMKPPALHFEVHALPAGPGTDGWVKPAHRIVDGHGVWVATHLGTWMTVGRTTRVLVRQGKRAAKTARMHERAERGRIRREAAKAVEARQEAKRQKAVASFQVERQHVQGDDGAMFSQALLVADLVKLGRACGGEVLTFVDASQDELHVPSRALARLASLPRKYAKRAVCTFKFGEHVPCLEVSWGTGRIRFHVLPEVPCRPCDGARGHRNQVRRVDV